MLVIPTWHGRSHDLKYKIVSWPRFGELGDHFLELHEGSRPSVREEQGNHGLALRVFRSRLDMDKMNVQTIDGRLEITYVEMTRRSRLQQRPELLELMLVPRALILFSAARQSYLSFQ